MDTFKLKADDGKELAAFSWVPAGNVRGVVQIAHGMAEHAARYDRLAQVLNGAGFAVYAADHRGHGATASEAELGHFADDDGWNIVLRDVKKLTDHVRAAHPGTPLALMGHSMGSFFVQHFMFAYPGAIDAAVLSGSNGKIGFLAVAGALAAKIERMRVGKRGTSALLDNMGFGAFNKKFKPNRTAFDWLSRDNAEVDKYVADPRCGFSVTTQTWLEVLTGLQIIEDPRNQAKVPKTLPVYIFSGSRDSVSNDTKNLVPLIDAYKAAGLQKVDHKIYPDARHETLNETNRDEVTRDLVAFLDKSLAKPA